MPSPVMSITTTGDALPLGAPFSMRAYVGSLILHVGLIALVLTVLMRPTRIDSSSAGFGLHQHGISAFVSVAQPAGPAEIAQPAPKTKLQARDVARTSVPDDTAQTGSGQGAGSSGSGGSDTGPVRLGSGEGLGIITRVQPVYPRLMQVSRTQGVVVVDAIVHRDGTIGDIKVLKSSGASFEQAAIEALKQWR